MALMHVQDRMSGNNCERGSLTLKTQLERESFLRLSAPLLGEEEPRESEKASVPAAALRAVYGHYVALGWLNGIAISTAFAYCYYEERASANTCTAPRGVRTADFRASDVTRAQALPGFFQLAWSFKFVIGAAQDATPVGGLHRAPYVLAGWAGCVGLGCALAVFADRLAMLPSTLANAYSCRFTAALLSSAAIAVLYDGPKQGGHMPFELSLRTWWAVGVAPAGCMLVAGVFTHVRDAERALPGRDEAAPSVAAALGRFRACLRRPAAHRVGVALFCITSLSLVTNSASNAAAIQWFGYSNLQYGVDNTMSYVTLTIVLQLLKAYALHCDWRALFSSAIFGMQAFYASFLIVVWCCWARNGWFYVFLNIDNQVAYDVTFFLSVVMVPELVEPGLEGVTYGAFTTLTNAAQNVASAVSVQLLGVWPLSNAALDADTHETRADVTRLQVACCLAGLAAIPFTLLLPSQKHDCARLRDAPSSRTMADAVLALIVLGMLCGATMSILPIVPATSCLKLVGGSGCGAAAAADDDAPGAAYCA
ncbi:hypothetical protein JL721_589 [Aureococcus anophagefferens]|nr:hypothetical protein JL721_589 [Aureococcus anophagefferens]